MKQIFLIVSMLVQCNGQCIDRSSKSSTESSVILVEENVKIFTRYELWNPLCEIKDHDDLTCVGLQDDENGSLNLSFPPDSSSFSLLLPDGYLYYAEDIKVKCSNNEIVHCHYSDNPDSDQFELQCSLDKCLDVNLSPGIVIVCEIFTHKHRDPYQSIKIIGCAIAGIFVAVCMTVYLIRRHHRNSKKDVLPFDDIESVRKMSYSQYYTNY